MRTSPEYMEERKIYQREVAKLKRYLPKDWIQIMINRRQILGAKRYVKYYNDLVNMINGRSYKVYLAMKNKNKYKKSLYNEIVELADKNRLENEKRTL